MPKGIIRSFEEVKKKKERSLVLGKDLSYFSSDTGNTYAYNMIINTHSFQGGKNPSVCVFIKLYYSNERIHSTLQRWGTCCNTFSFFTEKQQFKWLCSLCLWLKDQSQQLKGDRTLAQHSEETCSLILSFFHRSNTLCKAVRVNLLKTIK